MLSREEILSNIRKNKPQRTELPSIPDFTITTKNLVEGFETALKANSGTSFRVEKMEEINSFVENQFPSTRQIVSLVDGIEGNVDTSTIDDPHELKDLDLAIIKGELGVAENAAIWLSEISLTLRALPFITQHLVLVLEKKAIVANMHEAYKRIKINETGYGVFIAGPSKTADIEQSLVIGAHGSRSLTVALV